MTVLAAKALDATGATPAVDAAEDSRTVEMAFVLGDAVVPGAEPAIVAQHGHHVGRAVDPLHHGPRLLREILVRKLFRLFEQFQRRQVE